MWRRSWRKRVGGSFEGSEEFEEIGCFLDLKFLELTFGHEGCRLRGEVFDVVFFEHQKFPLNVSERDVARPAFDQQTRMDFSSFGLDDISEVLLFDGTGGIKNFLEDFFAWVFAGDQGEIGADIPADAIDDVAVAAGNVRGLFEELASTCRITGSGENSLGADSGSESDNPTFFGKESLEEVANSGFGMGGSLIDDGVAEFRRELLLSDHVGQSRCSATGGQQLSRLRKCLFTGEIGLEEFCGESVLCFSDFRGGRLFRRRG